MSERMIVRMAARTRQTLEDFAVEHGLVMDVRERSLRNGFPEGHPSRWYAHFAGAEIREGEAGLLGMSGSGSTPETAIADYGRRISEQLLIVDAMKPTRREIEVPVIVAQPLTPPTKAKYPEDYDLPG